MLGAGPAGVAAAHGCVRRGHDVTLVEARGGVGGHAASITVAERRVDLGSHRLHPACDPAVLADVQRLLGDRLVARRRHGRIRIAGRWVEFPLRPTDVMLHLPRPLARGLVRDLAGGARRQRASAGDSYAGELMRRFGPTMCEHLWFPYARKLWGLAPEEISVRQAHVRVASRSGWAVATRAMRGAVRGAPRFWYPRGGFGRISEAIADAAVRAGADLRLGASVTSIRFGATTAAVTAGGDEIEADAVLSTLPIGQMPGLVAGTPEGLVDAATALEHRAMILVYLVFDADAVTEFDAHYLPDDSVATARVSEPRHYAGDWPPGRTILCCEVPCTEGDTAWRAPDAAAAAGVVDDLAASGIDLPGAPTEAHVVRLRRVYPVFRIGHEATVATVESWIDGLRQLVTLGRQGLFLHDNSHHALEMGYCAAACTGAGGFDADAWARARVRFAANVVED